MRKERYVYRRKDKSKWKGNPYPTITAIMREDTEEYGPRGTVVTVPRQVMRNKLVAKRLADYAIPENFAKYGIVGYEEEKSKGAFVSGHRQGCPHVMNLLMQEDQCVTVKPRGWSDPWMVTRHDVVHQMMVDWQLYVPLSRVQMKTADGDMINLITELGTYVAEITVSNEVIEPPVVVSLPLHVVSRPPFIEGFKKSDESVVEGDTEQTIKEEGEEAAQT